MRGFAQSTDSVLMVRPCHFFPNPETAADNSFQKAASAAKGEEIAAAARAEFDVAVATLRAEGVTVLVMEDTESPTKPDAVFPNNWISTHHDGRVVLHPMFSPSRRWERRRDIIEELRRHYRVTEIVDYSAFERAGQCLEGTGSLVLDHVHRLAYASLSQRTHREPLHRFCANFDYRPVPFTSVDEAGRPIYHTNVVMCLGTDFALVGLDCIPDFEERRRVREHLQQTGKQIVELAPDQVANFAGNAIELETEQEKLLVLSSRALTALTRAQLESIERCARVVPLNLPTIELAGGSARCMLAIIRLAPL